MKWVCVAMVVINLLLAAVAGYQVMTVPDAEVREAQEKAEAWFQRVSEQAGGGEMTFTFEEEGEAHYYITNESGEIEMEELEYTREGDEAAESKSGSGYVGRADEAEFIVDQSSAMQLNSFPGVTNTRNKLRNIEKGRRDLDDYGKKAAGME